ncbi:ArsR/SmtB family transcription factor [Gimesia panareensis]|uniref:ArsR/SmtB family transcription factor n=1 Tax=Gimesia panareensis TaxID=2527978 RepID=UPI00118B898D|nr:helix-turn-helix transcriptional regulator [Gimesia panareensis]QDU52957.1 hypothetical protein Pan110_53390 [Gimesia panareensis]
MSTTIDKISGRGQKIWNENTGRFCQLSKSHFRIANKFDISPDRLIKHVAALSMPGRYVRNFRKGEIVDQIRFLDFMSKNDLPLLVAFLDSRTQKNSKKVWVLSRDEPGIGCCIWNAISSVSISAARGIQCVCDPVDIAIWSEHFKEESYQDIGGSAEFRNKFVEALASQVNTRFGWSKRWKIQNGCSPKVGNYSIALFSKEDKQISSTLEISEPFAGSHDDELKSYSLQNHPTIPALEAEAKSDITFTQAKQYLEQLDTAEYYLEEFGPKEILMHNDCISRLTEYKGDQLHRNKGGQIHIIVQRSRRDIRRLKVWLIGLDRQYIGQAVYGSLDNMKLNASDGIQFVSTPTAFFLWSQHIRLMDIPNQRVDQFSTDSLANYQILQTFGRTLTDNLKEKLESLDIGNVELTWKIHDKKIGDDGASLYAASIIADRADRNVDSLLANKDSPSIISNRLPDLARQRINEGPPTDRVEYTRTTTLLQALSHNVRLQTLVVLHRGGEPMSIAELHRIVAPDMAYQGFYGHLKKLIDADIVSEECDRPSHKLKGRIKYFISNTIELEQILTELLDKIQLEKI